MAEAGGLSEGLCGAPPDGLAGWRLAGLGIAWLLGLTCQLQQAALWPGGWNTALWAGGLVLCAVGAALLAGRLGVSARRRRGGFWLLAVGVMALAFGTTAWRASQRLADRLDPALEGVDLQVVGVIAAMPEQDVAGVRFTLAVEQAWRGREPVRLPSRVTLGWWSGQDEGLWFDAPQAHLQAGQRWRLPVRLKSLHGAMNPHGFDVELWWFEQGLGANGSVRVTAGGPAATWLADTWRDPVERLRGQLRDAIHRQVSDARAAAVLAALVVGDQAGIAHADWALFRTTGVAHLVSISGVHVTMFAWLAAALVGALWRRVPRWMLWVPAPLAARWGGLALATAYALLAGWGVPAQRTVWMLALVALLRSLGVRWPWLLVLLLAAVGVTVIDPWAWLQAGFWLSFAAVALLMVSEPVTRAAAPTIPGDDERADAKDSPGQGVPRAGTGPQWLAVLAAQLRAHGHAQTVATLGLAPLSLVFFGQLSVVGFLANLLAIPVVTLLITPLALLGVLLPPLWTLAAWLAQAGMAGLAVLADSPVAVWSVGAAPAWAVVSGLAGAVLGVLPVPWGLRLLAVPMVLPLLWPAPTLLEPGRVQLVVADVGQGTAVLVRTRQHLLVYDTGPQISLDSDAGQRVLLPLLQARGERRIDRLVLSHRDTDHVGGAASLMKALPVATLWSSLADDHPLRQRGVPHTRCEAGQGWQWDGVQFAVLHPLPADYTATARPNALSCVLQITDAAGRRILLTGDIEAVQEAALLERIGAEQLASQVLLVPHHGSRTSSTDGLLQAVSPRWAVVQAGYRSRYGHPAPQVVARYAARGIDVVRTDRCGAWTWQDGASQCTREVRRRYWHWQLSEGVQTTLVQ